MFDQDCHRLSLERNASKSGHKWFLSFSLILDFQAGVGGPIGCLQARFVLPQLSDGARFVFVGERFEQ